MDWCINVFSVINLFMRLFIFIIYLNYFRYFVNDVKYYGLILKFIKMVGVLSVLIIKFLLMVNVMIVNF